MAETPENSNQPDAEAMLAAAKSALSDLTDMGATVASAVNKPTPATAAPGPQALDLPNFEGVLNPAQAHAMELLGDVHLNVKIELGRTRMLVEDVLRLSEGAVVELDKLAGDPVDVYVNDRHVAKGEVLVLNDNFCVRINEVLAPATEAGDKGAA
ncbi:MAG TPA: flagellar motor switch protein FliN [Phycisphaerales bacterium]|nr:flagellar motor switch protein FliN [Phycisphaerales bacterium]